MWIKTESGSLVNLDQVTSVEVKQARQVVDNVKNLQEVWKVVAVTPTAQVLSLRAYNKREEAQAWIDELEIDP